MKLTRQRGFTLIEAAVAIAVVAILSGIIVPLVVKNINDSQNARAKNDVQVIAAAIASQIKDTGGRPTAAGPNGSTGAGDSIWGSGGADPTGSAMTGTCTFQNLFCLPKGTTATDSQKLFFGATTTVTATAEFAYKGPYLADDVALKSDPWGSRYLILGYNANGQTSSGPIWVVSAGQDKNILDTNVTVTDNAYPAVWTTTGVSGDDIVVRVN